MSGTWNRCIVDSPAPSQAIASRKTRCHNSLATPPKAGSKGNLVMHKSIGFAFLAVFVLTYPALGGDGKLAAEFALKTCLPAMEDLAKVEAMARENNWLRRPPLAITNPTLSHNRILSTVFKSQARWSATEAGIIYLVVTGVINVAPKAPYCQIDFNDINFFNNISRDEFFATICLSRTDIGV
jgi:hypothetical protein